MKQSASYKKVIKLSRNAIGINSFYLSIKNKILFIIDIIDN